jgi:hypothetical protein
MLAQGKKNQLYDAFWNTGKDSVDNVIMNVTLDECEKKTCPINVTLVDVCDIPNYGCAQNLNYNFNYN